MSPDWKIALEASDCGNLSNSPWGCVRKPGNTIKGDCKDKEPGATDINKSNSTLSTQSTGKIFPSSLKIQQSPVHSFEFLETDYYEQCHFINVVNLFKYMEEKNFVNTLKPYLQKKKIDEFVGSCVNTCDHKIDIVNKILKEECDLKIKGLTDISTNFALRYCETPILYETPNEKVICIYRNQIFDATQSESVTATTDELEKLMGKRKKLYNLHKYYKLTWDKIQSSNKSSSDEQVSGVKKPSTTLFEEERPLEDSEYSNKSKSAWNVPKSKTGWGGAILSKEVVKIKLFCLMFLNHQ